MHSCQNKKWLCDYDTTNIILFSFLFIFFFSVNFRNQDRKGNTQQIPNGQSTLLWLSFPLGGDASQQLWNTFHTVKWALPAICDTAFAGLAEFISSTRQAPPLFPKVKYSWAGSLGPCILGVHHGMRWVTSQECTEVGRDCPKVHRLEAGAA